MLGKSRRSRSCLIVFTMAHILITAGPTREYLDPVRFLSNASSGRMAAAIGAAALGLGHQVTVVSGPVPIEFPEGATVKSVVSTQEMLEAALAVLSDCDGVIAVAAPCDFRPVAFSEQKIKKSDSEDTLHLELEKTPDILRALHREKPKAWFVGFALETQHGLVNAIEKRRAKGCDLIVLNAAQAIGGLSTAVKLIDRSDQVVAEFTGPKLDVSCRLMQWIEMHLMV